MRNWLSGGTNLFRKVHTFTRTVTIYHALALIGHATLKKKQNVMTFRGDQTLQ